jgi:hypothetical protein
MQRLKEMEHHPSVRLAMSIANTEACRSGSEYIEPVHILLATLNIIDDCYDQSSESTGLRPEDFVAIREASAACRAQLTISDEQITLVRRRLHKILTELSDPPPIRKLEWSSESMYLIQKTARRTYKGGSGEFSLVGLFGELLNDLPKEIAPLLRN